jgi:haloacid dehalogenase superfamily, subfamily IA, variant 3 with third motif having DD or ED
MLYIFDLGGVFIRNIQFLPQMSEKLNIGLDELKSDYSHYDKPLMDGYMVPSDYYDHLERKYGVVCREDYFVSCFHPVRNEIMFRVLEKIKGEGNRAVIGSNTFATHWNLFMAEDFFAPMDGAYASHLMHLSKPDEAFFEFIMKAEGAKPEETVFIDDLLVNVEGARKTGIDGFWYSDDDALRKRFGL